MNKYNPDEYDDTRMIFDNPVNYAHIKVKISKSIKCFYLSMTKLIFKFFINII